MKNRTSLHWSVFLLVSIAVFGVIGSGARLAAAQTRELSPQVLDQIQALQEEKAARTPAQRKISSRLLYELKLRRGEPIARRVPTLRSEIEIAPDETVLMDITAQVTDVVLRQIKALGGEVLSSVPQYEAIRARLPLRQIEILANLPEVKSIRPADEATTNKLSPPSLAPLPEDRGSFLPRNLRPSRAERAAHVRAQLREALPRFAQARGGNAVEDGPMTNVVNISQGDVAHRANLARSTFGVTGAGIRIGVLSDGVNTLASRQATGDLPPVVTVLAGQAGNGDEGTAMLEIVYDLAPGAELFFATALNSEAVFAQNILNLQTAGCDIIVDNVGYSEEPVFQDGIIAQAVNTVTAAGALYFSAAGSSGNKNDNTSGVWEGDFVAATTAINRVPTHTFSGANSFANTITVDSPSVFTLQWSDASGASGNDYDLYLLNAALTTLLASSTNVQNGNDNPFESITSSVNHAGNVLVILKFSGAARYLHLNANRGRLSFNTSGQTWGHSAAVDAFSVAAVNVATAGGGPFVGGPTNPVESYSSDGLRRVFYTANGTAITPGNFSSTGGAVRQKPTIAAADCVATATPDFNPFCGTSAAAPHAAAIAALMLEANPSLVTAGVESIFRVSALDIEEPGVDRDSGVGILDAFFAVDHSLVADLAITKTDGAASEIPGTLVTYTITASNAGPSDVIGATVADTFPAELTGCTWTCVGAGSGTCPASGSGNINTSAVNLPSGGSATFTASCTISATATGSLGNTATVSSGVTDPTPGNNSATDTDTLTPQADLAISKTDGAASEVPGTLVTYTIIASNAGPGDVIGATVADTFPAELTGCTWTCVGAGSGTCPASGSGNINTSAVNLPSGGSATFTASCTISATATGSLGNTATVSSGVTDPTPGNNSATDTDTLTPQADLAISKTDGAASEVPGTLVTYTIIASNAGPGNVTGATVADTFPAELTGCTWTCVGAGSGTCPASGSGNINTSAVNLPSGGSATFTASCTISATATGSLGNTATVSSGVTDPTPGNNSATDTDTLTPQADLAISKTDGAASEVPGTLVTYTIIASNAGPGNVTGATVADTFPAELTGCTWTCVGVESGTCPASGSGNINTSAVNLPSGGSATFTASCTISAGASGSLANTATVSSGVTDPTLGNNSATDTDTLQPCSYTLTPPNQTVGSTGGPGNVVGVGVNDSECAWTAASNVPWIAVTAGNAGTDNGSVTYSVGANPGPNPRRGTMTIAGKTFTVTQATPVPAPCTITIPTGATVGGSAGAANFAVTASTGSCAWSAQSHVPWITITSEASGTGNGTVQYTVEANPGPGSRAGQITVNGKRYTVTQTNP